MVQINFAQKTVNVKIVYYGPGMSGKTTNLEVVHQRAPDSNRGDLTSISTDGDRTLFFDFMPLDLGTVAGMRTQFQIYTVPGQVYYNSTRKLVLQGVDGVIFIADSSASMLQENIDSLRNLQENLVEYGKGLDSTPYVIQYNKRDLPDAMPVEELERALNPNGVPSFEGVANTGQGVFPTLKSLAARVLDTIHAQHGGQTAGKPGPTATQAPAATPMAASEPPVNSAGTGFYPTPTPAPAPPVQSAGTGFYAAPQPTQQSQPPIQPPQQQQPAAPMEPAPLAAAAHLGGPEPVPTQPSIPMAGAAPQQQMPIQPSPEMLTGGVPSGFPQPAHTSPDALAKTQVHAPPQLAAESAVPPPPPGDGSHLRLMTQPPEHLQTPNAAPQTHQQASSALATQEAQAAPQAAESTSTTSLMQPPTTNVPPPQPSSRSIPIPNSQDLASTRLRPRSAVRTPRSGGERTAAFRTGVLVTLALAAGIILGSMVFSIL